MTIGEARKLAEIVDVWDSDSFVFEGLVCRLVRAFPEHDWIELVLARQPEWRDRVGMRRDLLARLESWEDD